MRNLAALTAKRLLKVDRPEVLYSRSLIDSKREYRDLARLWHPDCADKPEAPKVFAHISELYRLAQQKLIDGSWIEPIDKVENELAGCKKFRDIGGKVRSVEYLTIRKFELGRMYIGDHQVVFEIEDQFKDLVQQGYARIQKLQFADLKMATDISPSLPQIIDKFRTGNASILILRKTPDQVLLADALAHWGGKVPQSQHVGWIMNRLYDLACYMEWSGITHNAIAPETLFISPLRHSVHLLGGWWYAASHGTALTAIPERSASFIPPDIMNTRRSDVRADLELIKSVGRELLGDARGARLLSERDAADGADGADGANGADRRIGVADGANGADRRIGVADGANGADRRIGVADGADGADGAEEEEEEEEEEEVDTRPLVEWLLLPAKSRSLEDYVAWKHRVLPETFGRPRFVAMDLDSNQLYKEN